MNPFVIFGFMVWFLTTAVLFFGGTVAFLLSLLSASFFLSTLE